MINPSANHTLFASCALLAYSGAHDTPPYRMLDHVHDGRDVPNTDSFDLFLGYTHVHKRRTLLIDFLANKELIMLKLQNIPSNYECLSYFPLCDRNIVFYVYLILMTISFSRKKYVLEAFE